MSADPLRAAEDGLHLAVRVRPRSQPQGLAGLREGRLLIRLGAAPVDGAANAALVALLSERLGLPRSQVVLQRGERSRDKELCLRGCDEATVRARLGL